MSKAARPQSVIHVGNFLSTSGLTRQFIEELADRLERDGWLVIRTSSVLSRPLRLVDMLKSIILNSRKFSVGHIVVFSGPAFVWAEASAMVMRMLGRPYVLSLHGGNLPVFAKSWPGRMRSLLNSAEMVCAPSRYLFEEMRLYRSDIRLIPNPIQLDKYIFRNRAKFLPRLYWLRSFNEIYNPSLAPKVVALLKEEFPEIHLTMMGPDKGDGSLQEMCAVAERLGVSERIDLPGKVLKKDVPLWLDKGDIFLNTTNVDNTPISVMEAMACGLCVVSTNVGGLPYLLEHEHDALLVSPDNPQAMADAVRRILTDHELAKRLCDNARKKVEQFDWSIILPQWKSSLSQAAESLNS